MPLVLPFVKPVSGADAPPAGPDRRVGIQVIDSGYIGDAGHGVAVGAPQIKSNSFAGHQAAPGTGFGMGNDAPDHGRILAARF